MSTYRIYTHAERQPNNGISQPPIAPDAWDAYTTQDAVFITHWQALIETFAEYTFYICDAQDVILASATAAPLYFNAPYERLPHGGWRWVITTALNQRRQGVAPNMLAALGIHVMPSQRGKGISRLALQTMHSMAHGALIAPVRPSQKHLYPLIPMAQYAHWKRPDGWLFDAWMRTHQRMGARVVKVANRSMVVTGTCDEWHTWTGLHFPQDGRYVVAGALAPVTVRAGYGQYTEPNVWMLHPL